MRAEFIISATTPGQFPKEGLPEVAFLGRSNVGKSSLLNCLVRQPGLAFTSSKPGCTRAINFFRVDGKWHFVDLPGYGFARVPREQQHTWKSLTDAYLAGRQSLELCFLILDARRGWMESDLQLMEWLRFHRRHCRVVVTKSDKWKNQSARHGGLAALAGRGDGGEPLLFSALTGQGVREIWKTIQTIGIRP